MNKFREQTAVCIITCNRPEFFKVAVESINRDAVGEIFVVNAGDVYDEYPSDVTVIKCIKNPTVVGQAKNIGLRAMRDAGYTWLFVMEDDIKITNNKVFEEYIMTGCDSGLIMGQLSYGLHGGILGGNCLPNGEPNKRATVKYTKYQVDFYKQSFAAFTLFHKSIFKILGTNIFDERFLNAAEHLDVHVRLHRAAAGTNFSWFADILNSHEYIEDQSPNHENSVIRSQSEFMKNFSYSWQLFKEKHGTFPTSISDVSSETAIGVLENIETQYAFKNTL